MTKKITWTILIGIIIASLVYLITLFIPKNVHIDTYGVMYRNGETVNALEKSLKVQITGKVYREWFNEKYFRGDLEVEGQTYPVAREKMSLVEIPLDQETPSPIFYSFIWPEQKPGLYSIGSISMNDNYTEAVILVFEKKETTAFEEKGQEEDPKGWSFKNGLMIAAPANNRKEAVELTNELLYSYTGVMGFFFK